MLYDGAPITYNNLPDLSYDLDPGQIAAGLSTASGYKDITVTKSSRPFIDGTDYYVIVKNANDLKAISFDLTNLGGKDDATSVAAPTIEVTKISERSNDLFYLSIPNSYLLAPSTYDSFVSV